MLPDTWWVVIVAMLSLSACGESVLENPASPSPRGSLSATAAVYHVSMTNVGPQGLKSDCSADGYVLAHEVQRGVLNANGTAVHADGRPGPENFLDLVTGSTPETSVTWTRKYDVGRGTSGAFLGCFGETYAGPTGNQDYAGNLFIFFETSKGQPTVRFTWHFDYYLLPGNTVREHFTMNSAKLPFSAWTGGDVSGRVTGSFDLKYYLKEGRKIISSYQPIPGGTGLPFAFDLTIQREM